MTPSIVEIHEFLKARGAVLKKLNLKIDGLDTYEVQHSNGGFTLHTIHQLKQRYAARSL